MPGTPGKNEAEGSPSPTRPPQALNRHGRHSAGYRPAPSWLGRRVHLDLCLGLQPSTCRSTSASRRTFVLLSGRGWSAGDSPPAACPHLWPHPESRGPAPTLGLRDEAGRRISSKGILRSPQHPSCGLRASPLDTLSVLASGPSDPKSLAIQLVELRERGTPRKEGVGPRGPSPMAAHTPDGGAVQQGPWRAWSSGPWGCLSPTAPSRLPPTL